jgi:hypothetical protein
MGTTNLRKALTALGLALIASATVRPVWSMATCSGSYAATVLGSLPKPLVVGLMVSDDSRRNLDLAAQFRDGMRSAGVAVTGVPNAQLWLAVALSGRPGDVASGLPPGAAFSWMAGGIHPQLPDQDRIGGPQQAGQTTVQLRAELRPLPSGPVVWAAELQCAMQGDDERQLGYDLGSVIGGAIGRRVERTSF